MSGFDVNRQRARILWLAALILGLGGIASPASAALIISFSVTGGDADWSGSFEVDDGNQLVLGGAPTWIEPVSNVRNVHATNGSQSINFTPEMQIVAHIEEDPDLPLMVGWTTSDFGTAGFYFSFKLPPPLTTTTTWNDFVGQSHDLELSSFWGSGLSAGDFSTSSGQVTFQSQAIPEPSSMTLAALLLGIGAVVARRRAKRHADKRPVGRNSVG